MGHAGHVRVDDRVVRGEVAGTAQDPEGGQPAASRAAGVARAAEPARGAPGARPDGLPRSPGASALRRRAAGHGSDERSSDGDADDSQGSAHRGLPPGVPVRPWSPAGLPAVPCAVLVRTAPARCSVARPAWRRQRPVVAQPQRCHATATLWRNPVVLQPQHLDAHAWSLSPHKSRKDDHGGPRGAICAGVVTGWPVDGETDSVLLSQHVRRRRTGPRPDG